MTMFYFSFISHVRATLFLNVLKAWNNSETLKQLVLVFFLTCMNVWNRTILFKFYLSFILYCASRWTEVESKCIVRTYLVYLNHIWARAKVTVVIIRRTIDVCDVAMVTWRHAAAAAAEDQYWHDVVSGQLNSHSIMTTHGVWMLPAAVPHTSSDNESMHPIITDQ